MPTSLRESNATKARAQPGERELAAAVATLTLEQKVRLLTGADAWSLHSHTAIGLRRLVLSDGPAGVRGEHWDERDPSANVPSPTALAATWDEELVGGVGRLLASEARRKGVDVLLAPTVNLHRTPYGGRHFECFSEDPLLTARIGVAYVRGVQAGGVGATVKHFVANDSETERMTLDARIDERTLRELYLAPFETIVREAGVWSVMAAYNSVNGDRMTESPMLREILKREWGFDGVVMSDWFATRSTRASARAALDLVMPGPGGPWRGQLVDAVRSGAVEEADLDDKLRRILRLAARVGALGSGATTRGSLDDHAGQRQTLRRAAAAGFVLVRNRRLLPLDRGGLRRIAVIGPNAAVGRTLGGGSATVFAPYVVSPLAGLRAALPTVQVDHSLGVLASTRVPVAGAPWVHAPDRGGPGVEVRFVAADGVVLHTERRPGCMFHWDRLPEGDRPVASIEARASVRATDPGTYTIGGSGIGRYRLSVAGEEVFDGRLELAPGADVVEAMMIPPQATHAIHLERGEEVDIVLAHELASEQRDRPVRFALNLRPPHGTDDEEIRCAVSIAGEADVAVVVVGTTEEVESEGFDRASLSLPGRQDELVGRVAAANPDTVVAVNAGAPVLLPWADDVAAVLLTWFPGQEFGNALADVLLGDAEPGGRLPTTWPDGEDGLPTTRPNDGVLSYEEGLFIGYRGYQRDRRSPRYPFGHGLGYTEWTYEAIESPADASPGCDVPVTVEVRNVGARRGKEVIQLYASRRASALERPLRWLVGFAVVQADPGETVSATITVRSRAFEHFETGSGRWETEPGAFALAAGTSCETLPISTEIAIAMGERRGSG